MVDRKAFVVFHTAHHMCWCGVGPQRRARILGCGILSGYEAIGPLSTPNKRSTLRANDDLPRLGWVFGLRPSEVDVNKECYLVDPASSHMLVSKIKPCMCKYELIQTVKLRMAH